MTVLGTLLLAASATPSSGACVSTRCPDTSAIEQARGTIQNACGCTRVGQTHDKYEKCVRSALKLADVTALVPDKRCRKLIMKCENASVCGKPSAAVCCVQRKNGAVKASIVGSPANCRKGSACGALLGMFSKFDACAPDGACAGPSTTTTGPSATTTTEPSATSTTETTATTSSTTTTTTPATLSVDRLSQDFGLTSGTVASQAQTFTVSNLGGATSGALSISVSGTNRDEFHITVDGCDGRALDAAETCDVTVVLGPSGLAGRKSATLDVSADPGGEVHVDLTGESVGIDP